MHLLMLARRFGSHFFFLLALAAVACLPTLTAWAGTAQYGPFEEPPEPTQAQLWEQTQAAIEKRDFEQAEKLLKQYLRREPRDGQALRELGRVYTWMKRYEEALRFLDLYLELFPYDVDTQLEKARVLAFQANHEEAARIARQVVEREPENLQANLILGRSLDLLGRTQEADQVYDWVRRIDPGNPALDQRGAAMAGPGSEQPPSSSWLEVGTHMIGDINDFFFLGSWLGVRFVLAETFSLRPYARTSVLSGPDVATVAGLGGGLAARWAIASNLQMSFDANSVAYPQADTIVDWGGYLDLAWQPLKSLSLGLRGETQLAATRMQSPESLQEEIRMVRGQARASFRKGIFLASGDFALTRLLWDKEDLELFTTGGLRAQFRIVDGPPVFSMGYKLWYTGYTRQAPQNLYWSPAQYYSSQLFGQLSGAIGAIGWYYVEVAAGAGNELMPATGVGTDQEQAERWEVFPALSAAAGLGVAVSSSVDITASSWAVYSTRDARAYAMWNMELGLIYRW